MPVPILILIVVAGQFLGMLLLAIAVGVRLSVFLLGLLCVLELLVWQRRRLVILVKQIARNPTVQRLVDQGCQQVATLLEPPSTCPKQSTSIASVRRPGTPTASIAEPSEGNDELIDIQSATLPRRNAESIPSLPQQQRHSVWQTVAGTQLKGNLPRDEVAFFGPNTHLDLGRGVIESPLVYATALSYRDTLDASLIDGTLPVSSRVPQVTERLPYWPTYFGCSPDQRAKYLGWLLGGRSSPDMELGYVFIYFYGLERRVLVDKANHLPIAQEVIRLCGIYNHSNSFRNYSSAFLWLTILLAEQVQQVPDELLAEALKATGCWNDNVLGMCLACYHHREKPLPEDVALLVAQHDPRARSSVIVRRHSEVFQNLFQKRYHARFGEGLTLRASKQSANMSYRPASATLLRTAGYNGLLTVNKVPNVLGISSQFKPLLEIWNECIEDLQAYNRTQRAADSEQLTSEAYEALPKDLRDADHPEANRWMELWERFADEDGWPLIPAGELAKLKSIEKRERLTKSQCERLLVTADAMGIGLEPDSRLTERCYRWDEQVSPFFLETEEPEPVEPYNAAAVLLRLGHTIAEGDGHVSEAEIAYISEQLAAQFELTPNQTKRLEQLKILLLRGKNADKSITTVLRDRLPRNHRLLVGTFLVGIAALDSVVTVSEVAALKRVYRILGLEAEDLDKLLQPYGIGEKSTRGREPQPSEVQEFRLDMKAVSEIMQETREVSAILCKVMADGKNGENASSAIPTVMSAESAGVDPSVATATLEAEPATEHGDLQQSGDPWGSLPARFQPFLRAATARAEWPMEELAELARQHQLMLSGAIEAVNEWSCEHYGDWLIQEGDRIKIQTRLLEEHN